MVEQNAFGKYLQDIRRVSLLTAEEEIMLSRIVGDWKRKTNVSADLEMKGRRAKEKLIAANLGLVVHVAKKYLKRGLEMDDLVQEGAIGLDRAVDKFDCTQGCRFSTYAYWWIRQAMTRAIAYQSRLIRIPSYSWEKLCKINTAHREFMQQHGRTPTVIELANLTEIPLNSLEQLMEQFVNTKCASLDQMIGKERDTELATLIASNVQDTFEAIAQEHVRAFLCSLLETLTEREAMILRMRFGLDGEPPQTLQSIGKVLGVSRERIRQVETKALTKLRKHRGLRDLQGAA